MATITLPKALATVALTLTVAACGASKATPAADTSPSTTTTIERPDGLVDELVPIDSGRMHLRCNGSGDTTVLLIAGWGGGGESWGAIEPTVAERARVCSYARFGTGTSDPPSTTQTFATQATDLHELLTAAGEPGPYVIVGHSFGGAQAVTFTSQYADEVAGLMLLDTTPATWPTTACSVAAWKPLCDEMHNPGLDPERVDVLPAFEAVAAIDSLGELPMTVMTAAHRAAPTLTQGVERWASLSSASTVVTVQDTGHNIQLDQPALVIEEVTSLLEVTS